MVRRDGCTGQGENGGKILQSQAVVVAIVEEGDGGQVLVEGFMIGCKMNGCARPLRQRTADHENGRGSCDGIRLYGKM